MPSTRLPKASGSNAVMFGSQSFLKIENRLCILSPHLLLINECENRTNIKD